MNTNHFKEKLTEEKQRLEEELSRLGKPDQGKEAPAANWEATKQTPIDPADDTELADALEEVSTNEGIVANLDAHLKDVTDALSRIESDSYGTCETCNEQIGEDRLEANPAARTCKAHMG